MRTIVRTDETNECVKFNSTDRKAKRGNKTETAPSMLSVRIWLPKCLANEGLGPYIAGAGTRLIPSTSPRTRSRVLNPRLLPLPYLSGPQRLIPL